MSMNYKPKEFAKLVGVSIKTLHRWDANGKLKAPRTQGNQRFYTDAHLEQIKGVGTKKLIKTVCPCCHKNIAITLTQT